MHYCGEVRLIVTNLFSLLKFGALLFRRNVNKCQYAKGHGYNQTILDVQCAFLLFVFSIYLNLVIFYIFFLLKSAFVLFMPSL